MADPHGVELGAARHEGGCVVAAARGELTVAAVADLRTGLDKLLAEGLPVLLDVSDLQLTWAPGPEVFIAAVAAAGGWPLVRLVLFGAGRATTDRLTACRVGESVPLAATAAQAAELIDARPARLARGRGFAGEIASVRAVRCFLRDTLAQWGLPEHLDAEAVVTALAANAVQHAGTPFRVRLVFEDDRLRISVRDRRPGAVPDAHGLEAHRPAGQGLHLVGHLSRSWGVLHYADGKAVWAVLRPAPRVTATVVRAREEPPEIDDSTEEVARRLWRGPVPTDARSAATVTAPVRHRYATADPEQAHDFLRTIYGEHTLRLS